MGMAKRRGRSASVGRAGASMRSRSSSASEDAKKECRGKWSRTDAPGMNFSDGGVGSGSTFLTCLLFFGLIALCQVLGQLTALRPSVDPTLGLSGALSFCADAGLSGCVQSLAQLIWDSCPLPNVAALQFLACFMGVALLLDVGLPGKRETGPVTGTGHVPVYKDNAVLHSVLVPLLFWAGSTSGPLAGASGASGASDSWGVMAMVEPYRYDLGCFYDAFPQMISALSILGLVLGAFLHWKGLYFPSTRDSGTTGDFLRDFTWGTELYPRVFGVDIKRFVNCRFSMTFWMLAPLSFFWRSYTLHNEPDYGLLAVAASTAIYLLKFFYWEIGYMRSIDIIHDRAGWQIQGGCLMIVPSLYTLPARILVAHPSGLSPQLAGALFLVTQLGTALNYWADHQRQAFREAADPAKYKIFGKAPVFVRATYEVETTGARGAAMKKKKSSLLLASGFWGVARHFHYVFELTAAWGWCLLANPLQNGALTLFYCVFLTVLLADRAKRDERKCRNKYGRDYDKYCELVPYLILPGIY